MLTPGIPSIVREKFPQVVQEYEALIMGDHAALLDITFKGNELLTVTIHHYLTCKACLNAKTCTCTKASSKGCALHGTRAFPL